MQNHQNLINIDVFCLVLQKLFLQKLLKMSNYANSVDTINYFQFRCFDRRRSTSLLHSQPIDNQCPKGEIKFNAHEGINI